MSLLNVKVPVLYKIFPSFLIWSVVGTSCNGGGFLTWDFTLNLVVPHGEVRFILYDDRHVERIKFQEIIISKNNYFRLTIPPLIWLGFQGLSKNNSIVLNIANIHHSPDETDKKNIDEIEFDWGV